MPSGSRRTETPLEVATRQRTSGRAEAAEELTMEARLGTHPSERHTEIGIWQCIDLQPKICVVHCPFLLLAEDGTVCANQNRIHRMRLVQCP